MRPITGTLVPGEMHVGAVDEGAEVAVGISKRDRGHATGPGRPPCGTVSNGLESVNSTDLQDACVQGHRRQHRVGLAGQGIDAVERRARPQQVEMVVGPEEDARGVGERRRRARHGAHEVAEARELLAVDRVVRLLRRHEMAHQQGKPQPAQAAALVGQHLRLLGAEAQPVHAGVDMDHRVERPVEALRRGAPGIELAEMVEHRREAELDEVGARCRAAGRSARRSGARARRRAGRCLPRYGRRRTAGSLRPRAAARRSSAPVP